MKNIFLIETDEPSYLYSMSNGKLYISDLFEKGSSAWKNKFIYITNEEDIKEGDWCIFDRFPIVVRKSESNMNNEASVKKICLTNDTSLIEDGVQSVNNLFLPFYAENKPNCVEVKKWLDDEGKKIYTLDFTQEKTKIKELLKEIIKNDEELKLYETENQTLEEETLEKIKFVLSCGNDAQAIRLLEKYGDLRESVYLKQKINLRNKQ